MNEAEKRNQRDLQGYLVRQVLAAQDDLAPELIDYVTGDSREAIDRSIALVKQKSAQLVQRARQEAVRPSDVDPTWQQAMVREGISDQQIPDVSAMSWAQYSQYRRAAGIGQSGGGILDPIGR